MNPTRVVCMIVQHLKRITMALRYTYTLRKKNVKKKSYGTSFSHGRGFWLSIFGHHSCLISISAKYILCIRIQSYSSMSWKVTDRKGELRRRLSTNINNNYLQIRYSGERNPPVIKPHVIDLRNIHPNVLCVWKYKSFTVDLVKLI